MPPRLKPTTIARSIAFRPKLQKQWTTQSVRCMMPLHCRLYSDANEPPAADRSKRADAKPMEHVSEEKAAVAEAMGEQGPDLSQGTPIEEVVKGDHAAQQNLPKVMQDKLKSKTSDAAPKGSRSYSTMTTQTSGSDSQVMALVGHIKGTNQVSDNPGLKFPMPPILPRRESHVKHRYDPIVDQVTNLLMRHGKKSIAQRNMALILQHLRTSPIPKVNPQRPLIPGAPPPSHLPLNPVLYLTLAIDSVAPLLRIRNMKGQAGGGVALPIPVPLGQRQRRRAAIQWILSSASRRKNTAVGKNGFAQRVAQELIAVVQGTSSTWERRNGLHKQGVAARSNVVVPKRR